MLHGRERLLKEPRTAAGQTVPEQVIGDRYRALLTNKLNEHVDEKWLIHLPVQQLREMLKLVEGGAKA